MNRWLALFFISLTVLLSLTLWFSASVVQTQLEKAWDVGKAWDGWIASAVQIGFIVGSLTSSLLMIPDRMNSRKMFALSSLGGSCFNATILLVHHAEVGLLLRFLTGMTLAGIYPIGVKLLSQWFQNKRGLSMGILIASFTFGSALPHYAASLYAGTSWKMVILASTLCSLVAAGLVLWVLPDAPNLTANASKVSVRKLGRILRNRGVMYTNYGYFGHMWELYAMWAWLPIFLRYSFGANRNHVSPEVDAYSFFAIGVAGAVGCVIGGLLAEKVGKPKLSAGSMLISGSCSVLVGFTFGKPIWITVIFIMLWGMSVIADSAQFSAAVTEYAEPDVVGTAVTFQIAIGFLISIVSINLIPVLSSVFGWKWVFSILSVGPLLGAVSMVKLNRWKGMEANERANNHYQHST